MRINETFVKCLQKGDEFPFSSNIKLYQKAVFKMAGFGDFTIKLNTLELINPMHGFDGIILLPYILVA